MTGNTNHPSFYAGGCREKPRKEQNHEEHTEHKEEIFFSFVLFVSFVVPSLTSRSGGQALNEVLLPCERSVKIGHFTHLKPRMLSVGF